MITALIAARLATPLEVFQPGVVLIEDGRIAALGHRDAVSIPDQAQVRDLGGATLTPGLIDLHVHGGDGVDLMTAGPGDIAGFARHLARHGVTAFCPTTVTAAWPDVLAAVERLAPVSLGVHLEGPFLSPGRRGVHPANLLLEPRRERLEQLRAAAAGRLRLITLAPELPGAAKFITAANAAGIRVSLGHTQASLDQTLTALRAGAHHFTHCFNAMPPLHHRAPGPLGALLADTHPTADIIADGIHLHPSVVAMFLRLLGPERAVLISDAISAAGCPAGRYRLGPITVDLNDGRCTLADDPSRLAGSVLTLDQALLNVARFTRAPWIETLRLATLNPAQVLGLNTKGRLFPGADADLVAFSPYGQVLATYIAGQQVK